LSLTLWASGIMWYITIAAMGDRATQECDPSTTAVPYGIGLVASLLPTLYDYADGYNAINSPPKADYDGLF